MCKSARHVLNVTCGNILVSPVSGSEEKVTDSQGTFLQTGTDAHLRHFLAAQSGTFTVQVLFRKHQLRFFHSSFFFF